MHIRHCLPSTFLICLIFTAFIFVSGCGVFQGASAPEQGQSTQSEVETKPLAIYHDFEDVLVPEELTIIKNRTVVVSTPGFRSGILTLRGRVESNSLYNFFSINMEKDNWEVISRIKAPETTIMVYQKATRCAVITIREEQIYTYVEIGIAPTLRDVSETPINSGTLNDGTY
ncbi:hypothetical protein DO021_01440 [Desulfobacter hydrogenophilus]|uniref:Uncharacterized protein n=1 Tax=Desulfobacter hydrogenophilus TaxID=2291 RepID=A0A328FGN5_9BACT|nr:hypothetical protein [Desulfobacter hydrogenophilus]NDY71799.1 hypothetical protein [Desulfobacter hydrogenophilus]QBH13497.1 hypothetical protein EYB58_11510 [Desulfobacter hydrogenophilus]RAM03748.1 hypothetical protein DO021_01440 [Desulfobacter hydrogenophilus]